MRALATLFLLLTAVGLMTIPAAAHHSTAGWFDVTRQITLDGTIARVEWINPHTLISIDVRNEKGESEEWILQGFAPNAALSRGLKRERLVRGTHITVRGWPTRPAQVINGRLTAYSAGKADPAQPSHIVEAGEIKFENGDIQIFGRGPGFDSSIQR